MSPDRQKRSATLRDVAEVAGVSPSTASRVLNGDNGLVTDVLARRVRAVADSLGYVSNQAARALRGQRTAVVLLATDPRTASVAAMAAGMEAAGRERRALVSIVATGTDPRSQMMALSVLRGMRPRALVVTSASFVGTASDRILPELHQMRSEGCSVVFIGEHESDFPAVRFDDVEVGRTMGRYAGELGRSCPAVISSEGHPAMESRRRGFLEGLAEHGYDAESVPVEYVEVTREGGRDAARRLLARRNIPDLVLAGNDVLAIGVLTELRTAGRGVPTDVSVCGVDDIPIAQDLTPSLTTVRLPFFEAGRAALDLCLGQSEDTQVHLPGQLVVRESSAPDRAFSRGG